jgi:hypothetical protein
LAFIKKKKSIFDIYISNKKKGIISFSFSLPLLSGHKAECIVGIGPLDFLNTALPFEPGPMKYIYSYIYSIKIDSELVGRVNSRMKGKGGMGQYPLKYYRQLKAHVKTTMDNLKRKGVAI